LALRSYDVKVAALALDVPPKWLDNLLSHHQVPGVQRGRQGVDRRIADHGLTAIAIVRLLCDEIGLPVPRAVQLAQQLYASEPRVSSIRTESGVVVELPVAAIEATLRERLPDALLAAPTARRGRPPR
jgi:hypothetical protein